MEMSYSRRPFTYRSELHTDSVRFTRSVQDFLDSHRDWSRARLSKAAGVGRDYLSHASLAGAHDLKSSHTEKILRVMKLVDSGKFTEG